MLQLLSRSGLWLYELVVRQIAQETIPEHVRGKVNGQWRSMISFFDMSMYIAAILVSGTEFLFHYCTSSLLLLLRGRSHQVLDVDFNFSVHGPLVSRHIYFNHISTVV
jgi:hypothetical protein